MFSFDIRKYLFLKTKRQNIILTLLRFTKYNTTIIYIKHFCFLYIQIFIISKINVTYKLIFLTANLIIKSIKVINI